MKRNIFTTGSRGRHLHWLTAVPAVLLALGSMPAYSQSDDGSRAIDEVVTTGTRREGQLPTETLSPIDVLAGAALTDQATFDLTDGLTKVAPSIGDSVSVGDCPSLRVPVVTTSSIAWLPSSD